MISKSIREFFLNFRAARFGVLKMVSELVGRKASVCATDRSGNTPLHLACEAGHMEVAKVRKIVFPMNFKMEELILFFFTPIVASWAWFFGRIYERPASDSGPLCSFGRTLWHHHGPCGKRGCYCSKRYISKHTLNNTQNSEICLCLKRTSIHFEFGQID